ncbi:hypothetical protein HPP92_001062 [Vanilla planifolia]|uniref:Uncharacterized protein n=1 Tax=Vanilla planifolia TaxID=51239 RepID=A0A835RYL7_VANPL|nr:hypothetical protein HPP92_001062 [Vanilla planifolia]
MNRFRQTVQWRLAGESAISVPEFDPYKLGTVVSTGTCCDVACCWGCSAFCSHKGSCLAHYKRLMGKPVVYRGSRKLASSVGSGCRGLRLRYCLFGLVQSFSKRLMDIHLDFHLALSVRPADLDDAIQDADETRYVPAVREISPSVLFRKNQESHVIRKTFSLATRLTK